MAFRSTSGAAALRPLALATTGLLTVVALFTSTSCTSTGSDEVETSRDPGQLIHTMVAGMTESGPYRDPRSAERSAARAAVRLLLTEPRNLDGHAELFGELGFDVFQGIDPATGRPYSLFLMASDSEPAWGALLVDRSAQPRHVIEVPHPRFDIDTESLGLMLHRQVPGSVLLVAGQHRKAAGGAADVAHNNRSLFHVLATEFARNGLAQLQLHGFADQNLLGSEVVVSTGAGPVSELARELADGLRDAGFVTCRPWATRCGRLEGTRNEQGQAAAGLDAPFIHLELSWSVRRYPERQQLVAETIAPILTAVAS